MSWPDPRPGLVIRYSYLWFSEHRAGREEGVKDRPCAVILALRDDAGSIRVFVLPITHAIPSDQTQAIEIPRRVKVALGLDSERSWIVVDEFNEFDWPGPDLRFLSGGGPETCTFGFLPPRLLREVRERFLALCRAGTAKSTRRTI